MFKVTIQEIKTVQKTKQEWMRVADSGNEKDGGAIYAYVPHEIDYEDDITIYEQTVEDLDISDVIIAVNKLDVLRNGGT